LLEDWILRGIFEGFSQVTTGTTSVLVKGFNLFDVGAVNKLLLGEL
jgi:hypothetical protein